MNNPAAIEADDEARAPGLGYSFVLLIAVLLCLFAAVATVTIIDVTSPLGHSPPTMRLTIDGHQQESMYGDFSWRGVIADAFQRVAPSDPLKVQPHFSATLNLDTRLGPPSKSSCKLLRVERTKCLWGDPPEFVCWWPEEHATPILCPALGGATESRLEFTAPPGPYVLEVQTWWDQVGGTRQNFSIDVQ